MTYGVKQIISQILKIKILCLFFLAPVVILNFFHKIKVAEHIWNPSRHLTVDNSQLVEQSTNDP